MIFSDSRYATADLYKAFDARRDASYLVVEREFPITKGTFFYYLWKEGDRIESVAAATMGDANAWWAIMDFNPEISNPFSIPIGTILRIPSE